MGKQDSSRHKNIRSQNGAVSTVLLSLLLLVTIAVASLSVDISHAVLVRSQLQNAVDSAALAGAYATSQGTTASARAASAVTYATATAAANTADNVAVASTSPGMAVQVVCSTATSPYTVTVTATRTVTPLFSRLFGAYSFPVSARAVAAGASGLTSIYSQQACNLVISVNTIPTSGPQAFSPLNTYTGFWANRPFTIVLNSQGSKNGAWTTDWSGTSAPSLNPGSSQVNLTNGAVASQLSNLSVGQTLVVPLIQGDAPFNDRRTVVGVMGFKITSINKPDTITGYVTVPVCRGVPGLPVIPSASVWDNQFLQQWAPTSVHLVQ